MHNLEANISYRGEPSKICLICATANRLRGMPCEEHFPAMPSELCEHRREKLIFIENGTALGCYDCNLFVPSN